MCWCDRLNRTPYCGSQECFRIQQAIEALQDNIKSQQDTIDKLKARLKASWKMTNKQAKLLKMTKRCAVCKHFQFIGMNERIPHCNFRHIGVNVLDTCMEFGVNPHIKAEYENNHCRDDYVLRVKELIGTLNYESVNGADQG